MQNMPYKGVNHGNHAGKVRLPVMIQEESMGQRITRLAEAKGLTQSEIGRRLAVSRASVGQWFSDASPNIRPANLLALASLLGTTPHYLVFGALGSPRGGLPPPADPVDPSASGTFRMPLRRPKGS
jgi:transcriptional regulator with XRE-family HTH domain